jgi:hypothetical protein
MECTGATRDVCHIEWCQAIGVFNILPWEVASCQTEELPSGSCSLR